MHLPWFSAHNVHSCRNRLLPKRLMVLVFFFAPFALAQVPYPYDPAQDPTQNPLRSYDGSDIDQIDIETGALTVKIPLISYPQRGGVLHLDLTDFAATPGIAYTKVNIAHGGGRQYWQISNPFAYPCCTSMFVAPFPGFPGLTILNQLVATSQTSQQAWINEADGSSHSVGFLNANEGRTLDGSGFYISGLAGIKSGSLITIIDKNGVRTSITYGSISEMSTDPNGNQMTLLSGTLTDTMGRQIPLSSYYGGTFGGSLNLPGLNGGTETLEFSSPTNTQNTITLPNNASYTSQSSVVALPLLPGQTTAQTTTLLTKVTLPTGGSISWTYPPMPGSSGCTGNSIFPVQTRTLDANDGTGPHTWTYSHTYTTSSPVQEITTVTDPLGNRTVYTFGVSTCVPFPTQVQRYDNKGNLLQTSIKTYSYLSNLGAFLNVNLASETTIWPTGQQSQTSYTYDRDNGHSFQYGTATYYINGQFDQLEGVGTTPAGYTSTPWTVKETDYANGTPGPVIRQTNTTYMAFSGPNAASYLSGNLLEKPYTVKILDSGNNQTALTQYNYDESNGSPAGVHGNLTSSQRWLNTTGANLTTSNVYNSNGLVVSTLDPKSNSTTFGYSGNYAGSGPTSVKNALGQINSYAYDLNTSLLLSHTDQNNQQTTYSYNDPLYRLTKITYPVTYDFTNGPPGTAGAGYTSYAYVDTVGSLSVTQQDLQNTIGGFITHVTKLDGLGRTIHSQFTSDPVGTTVDTVRDALGRVQSVSNPYHSTSDLTYGVTSYTYDALGRQIVQTQPDNSVLQWCYNDINSGQTASVCTSNKSSKTNSVWVDYVDESGVHWQRVSDALGRLTAVVEQVAAPPTLETDYSYDALSNLLNVTQNGLSTEVPRTRSFTYDSLSRLICASNSESSYASCPTSATTALPAGVTSYSYDANGNTSSKTDARGIGVIYNYDALNRLISKTPSNNTGASFYYNYDETTISWNTSTLSNTIGRLSSAWANYGGIYSRYGYSYDAMGRQTSKLFELPNSTGLGVNTSVGASGNAYDLVGDVTYFNNGAGVSLSETRDGARHVTAVTSNKHTTGLLNSISSYQIFAKATYSPFGGIASRLLGNGLTENTTYDKRGRLLSSSQFQAGSSIGYSVSGTYYPNGNLKSSNDSVNGNWTYTYDPVNRLNSATSSTGLILGWTYDSFGNRWTQTASGTGSAPQPSFTYSKNNNHADASGGFLYDNAGNITKDNLGQTYAYYPNDSLATVNAPGGTGKYRFDSEDQLVFENGPNGAQVFLRDNNGHSEYSGNLISGYVVMGVYIDGEQIGSWQHDQFFWTGKDWLGTKRYETAGNGDIGSDAEPIAPASYTSLPFGDALSSIGNDPTHFTGKERDVESGLDYFGARYYGSSMGRFISPDDGSDQNPFDPQSWNLYSYGRNNPLIGRDDDGHTYNVCPPGTPSGSSGCTNIEDKTFESEQKQDQANGVSFAHGTISDSSGVEGTYTHDPDIAGDSAANIAAMGNVGNLGIGAINWFGKQMLINAATDGLLGAAGAAYEGSSLATQFGRNIAKGAAGEVMANAILRMKGYKIVGSQVSVMTSAGRRVVDFVVEKDGELLAIEVKTGRGRDALQLAKDAAMENQGGRIGPSGGAALAGQTLKLRTIEMSPW
jgi:RHS repeat-associated protein